MNECSLTGPFRSSSPSGCTCSLTHLQTALQAVATKLLLTTRWPAEQLQVTVIPAGEALGGGETSPQGAASQKRESLTGRQSCKNRPGSLPSAHEPALASAIFHLPERPSWESALPPGSAGSLYLLLENTPETVFPTVLPISLGLFASPSSCTDF